MEIEPSRGRIEVGLKHSKEWRELLCRFRAKMTTAAQKGFGVEDCFDFLWAETLDDAQREREPISDLYANNPLDKNGGTQEHAARPDGRRQWKIDHVLAGLIGQDVRVVARKFSPRVSEPVALRDLAPVCDLILPDNSRAQGLPVFFEGKLRWFQRQVGVVFACLEARQLEGGAADGFVPLRGGLAVVVNGPAVVELDHPFRVERLPKDSHNYWRDVRLPQVQFELGFGLQPSTSIDRR